MADKPTDDNQLSDQQLLFVDEYLKDLNGTQAAIRAGYSEVSARVQAHRLLTNDNIQELIDKKMHARSKRLEITADKVLREVAKIAFANIKMTMRWDEDGNAYVVPSDDMDNSVAAAISEVNHSTMRLKGELVSSNTKVKMHDKQKALDMLIRHLGLYKNASPTELPPFGSVPSDGKGIPLTLENLPLFMEIARRSTTPSNDSD